VSIFREGPEWTGLDPRTPMKKTTLLLASLLATACGPKLDPDAIRAALPDKAAVRISQPDPGAARALPAGGTAALRLEAAAAPGRRLPWP
jgi:hypothetical protein